MQRDISTAHPLPIRVRGRLNSRSFLRHKNNCFFLFLRTTNQKLKTVPEKTSEKRGESVLPRRKAVALFAVLFFLLALKKYATIASINFVKTGESYGCRAVVKKLCGEKTERGRC